MMINTGAAALYGEPYGSEMTDEVWYGQRVELMEDLGEYLKVRTEYGYRGYIRRRQITDWEYSHRMQVISLFADVMEGPSYQSGRLLTLPRGGIVDGEEENDGWQRIRLIGGGQGYVISSRVAPEPRNSPPYPVELRRRVTNAAMSYLGVPYRWGGRTPAGIDCSGLCHAAYLMCGVAIFRDSRIENGYPVRQIPIDAIEPADLIYFPGHMAMYLGNGKYIHATGRTGEDRVRINSLNPTHSDYRSDLAERVLMVGSVF